MLDKIRLLLTENQKAVTVEPNGEAGCIFIMNLPMVKDGRIHPVEVLMDPWPVPAWVSFN